MNTTGTLPQLSLSPIFGSFDFQRKHISFVGNDTVVLGSEVSEVKAEKIHRTATAWNGWFASIPSEDDAIADISPLSLSTSHAELWLQGGQVYIRDLESPFGTFVNNVKISQDTVLNDGDIIRLGTPIARNDKTPAYITDDHLRPILAKVTLLGAQTK